MYSSLVLKNGSYVLCMIIVQPVCILRKWTRTFGYDLLAWSKHAKTFATIALLTVSGQLPTRTIPTVQVLIGPHEWFYSVVVVLVGSCPGGD